MVTLLAAAGSGPDAFQPPLASLQVTSSAGSSLDSNSHAIDAGIIFTAQTNFRCLPLAELGLDGVSSASHIAEVSTSCECVTASLVGYHLISYSVDTALFRHLGNRRDDQNVEVPQ